jgi:hypothetical protein
MPLFITLYILWGVLLRTSLNLPVPAPAEPAPRDTDPKD